MNNYLQRLREAIKAKWPEAMQFTGGQSENFITSIGYAVQMSPCWYIYAESDESVTIELYHIENPDEFLNNLAVLHSGAVKPIEGVRSLITYFLRPEVLSPIQRITIARPTDTTIRAFAEWDVDGLLDNIEAEFMAVAH